MGEPCKVIQLRPAKVQEPDERTYTEAHVKQILYGFARDLERKRDLSAWRADKLKKFIETIFNFD